MTCGYSACIERWNPDGGVAASHRLSVGRADACGWHDTATRLTLRDPTAKAEAQRRICRARVPVSRHVQNCETVGSVTRRRVAVCRAVVRFRSPVARWRCCRCRVTALQPNGGRSLEGRCVKALSAHLVWLRSCGPCICEPWLAELMAGAQHHQWLFGVGNLAPRHSRCFHDGQHGRIWHGNDGWLPPFLVLVFPGRPFSAMAELAAFSNNSAATSPASIALERTASFVQPSHGSKFIQRSAKRCCRSTARQVAF